MAATRSDAISFVGLILLYGYFVYGVIDGGLDQPGLIGRTLGFFVLTAVVLGLVQIVAALALGRTAPEDREAERDIGHRSGRNAYVATLSLLWAVPFLLAIPGIGVNLTIVACVGLMGLTEVVRYGSRLAYRGLGLVRNQRALAG
jgi:hypothetical protein